MAHTAVAALVADAAALIGASRARARARTLTRFFRKNQLRGKTVLIVGGSRGLGLDLARVFAARGCQLAICARDEQEVERARRDLEQRGSQVLARVCDATSELEVQAFVQASLERFGALDVLVTSAATIQVGPVELMTKHDFEEALSSIFWTTYYPTMAVLPHMRQRRRGRIVHITSFSGKVATPHLLPYSTAKFAATGFSQGLRMELAKDGISVTTIVPSLLRTGAHLNVPIKGQHEKEFAWFSLGATLPLISLSSERAARKIVAAAEHGASERALTVKARMLIMTQAFAPSLVSSVLAIVNRLMPSAIGGSSVAIRGADVAARASSRVVRAIDLLGQSNAELHHEIPGPIHIKPARVQAMA